ncbi:MAG TPA: hypothetical protein PKC18_21300 [Lacipirellulaceae bacterium]|nr:hypothetical protein [Lacipirellulaceae bacterium]
MMKRFLFRYYPWVAAAGCLIGWAVVWLRAADHRLPLLGGVLAAAFGLAHLIQQQKLAETQLFKALFTEFNQRYNELNERLDAVSTPCPMPTAASWSTTSICARKSTSFIAKATSTKPSGARGVAACCSISIDSPITIFG